MGFDLSHFCPRLSQSLTECLVDNSEQSWLQDREASEAVVWDDWREAASGWQLVGPYPKYATRRHRSRQQKTDPASRKGLASRSHSDFHCFTEDNHNQDNVCYPWKDGVEPVNYSYVPNNGFYRDSKPTTRLTKEVLLWLEAVRGSGSAKSMLARQLRKAAENTQKMEWEVSASREIEPQPVTTNTPNKEPITPLRKRHGVLPGRSQSRQRDKTTEILQFAAKRLQSQAQTLNTTVDRNSYYTSFTESNTTSCNSGVSRKSSDLTLHGHFPLNAADKRQLTNAYMPNTTRLAIQTKNSQRFEEDLFTFIPMCRQEVLRPLESLRPASKQKGTENTYGAEKRLSSQSGEQGKGEQGVQEDTVVPSAPAVLPTAEESCGIRTARSAIAKTNLRIEEMRNSPLRSSQTRSFFAHKGSGLALLKNGVLRYTVTK